HFTGGEPFLNYALLLEFAKLARAHGLNSNFVETNCFWCTSEKIAEERFAELKENGLGGVLVSVNPFLAEFVPFENAERAIRIGREIFGGGLMVYHPSFYRDMVRLRAKGRTGFGEYLKAAGAGALASLSDAGVLLPMGRLVWRHGSIFERFPPERFFHENCLEELTRRWHAHVDNYGNYISGYCAGLSLGRLGGSGEVFETGIDLDEHPVLKAVASSLGELFDYAKRGWGFKPNIGGYVSKCHLCLDVRKHLVDEGSGFEELSPGQFYDNL
ncbi:MAG: hypothetical protein JTT11_04775, partial [Candidatus Brockarchaeota archaeon]|nr:hypothetical protein [Candidatus Brockarchaeota archaeon]